MIRITQGQIGGFQPLYGLGTVRLRESPLNHQTLMLANQRPGLNGLPDFLVGILQKLADWLGVAFNTLGDIVDIPLGILGQGIDVMFDGLASVVGMVPVLGPLLSEIVLLGGTIIAFALTVPGLILHEFGNLLEGAAKWLDTKLTPDEKEKNLEEEKKKILDKAPDPIKDTVESILDASGIGSKNTQADVAARAAEGGAVTGNVGTTDASDPGITPPSEESFLEKIAPVAAPAAAAGLLLAVVLS